MPVKSHALLWDVFPALLLQLFQILIRGIAKAERQLATFG